MGNFTSSSCKKRQRKYNVLKSVFTISHCLVAAGVKSRSSPCTNRYFNTNRFRGCAKIASARKVTGGGRRENQRLSSVLAYFSRSAVLECGGGQGSRPLFFLALYRLQNAKHFICWIISSYFSRLPPLRICTSRSEGDYNLEQNPPIPPLNRG